jgi:hypothetical protein
MMTRRELVAFVALFLTSAPLAATRQAASKEPKVTTVTLIVSGMT